jgi:hypothetical protein
MFFNILSGKNDLALAKKPKDTSIPDIKKLACFLRQAKFRFFPLQYPFVIKLLILTLSVFLKFFFLTNKFYCHGEKNHI